MKLVVIGYGARGDIYTPCIMEDKDSTLVAVCDVNPARLKYAQEKFNLTDEQLYTDEDIFFSKGKMADLCIVSTQDHQHKGHAIKALNAGYDLLLEKPIANTLEDCIAIYDLAKKLNRKVFVCHVLRYAPFFACIKEQIDSGKYGKIQSINLTENVGHWHQAHSYVRGNWRKTPESSPMIIAKCCHDLDIIAWLMGDNACEKISSFGSLSYFTKEHAPKDSAERCMDCKYADTCPYSAKTIYLTSKNDETIKIWPCDVVVQNPTFEKVTQALKGDSPYGRCVFKCDNNVVDHQVVNMRFANNATAHLTMTAFSSKCYREIHVHLDNGDIYGDMINNKLYCTPYYQKQEIIDINFFEASGYGHGGGDNLLCADIVKYYKGESCENRVDISQSMRSHFMGFCAEESRINDGEALVPHQ